MQVGCQRDARQKAQLLRGTRPQRVRRNVRSWVIRYAPNA
jgi:hypothetical protein